MEKNVNIFVIDENNFDFDFLIRLDCIKNIQIIQNEKF